MPTFVAHTPRMSVGLVVGNRYELTARIGRGGFGSVWQARDTTLRREVAVKLLEVAPGDQDVIARFWREAQAVASLNHPNIVIAHDFGVFDNAAYLVMELITGESLAEELGTRRMANEPPLDFARVVALGTQVASALAAAHSAGLVHRDLKPANIMLVRATGAVKIVDFGIAHISDLSRLTKPGGYLGTLPYASPEQMSDGVVDGRSDLYSLGCLLYELLTDHSAYVAESPAQWIAAHQSAMPTPIRTYLPAIAPEMESLVHALLAKDPARRPADATAVRERLERVQLGPSAGPTPKPTLIDSRPLSPTPVAGIYLPGRAGSGVPAAPVRGPQPAPGQVRPNSARPGQAPSSPAIPGPYPASPSVPGRLPVSGQPAGPARRPVPAGPGAVSMLGGAPGAPFYTWTQVPTPQGWMAVPQLVSPYPPPPRPGAVTAAGRILTALAVACGIEAVIVVGATVQVGQAAQRAFAKVPATTGITTGGAIVGAMMFAAVAFVVTAAITGILAGVNLRGSRSGRIWTWVLSGLSLPWVLGAIGSKDVASLAAKPSAADAGRPRVLAALAQVRAEIPGWYVTIGRLFDVFAVFALIAVIVLIALPPSNAYFRSRHGIRR
jgi:eukaryotic-like serine/threonine-protein kinase